ncbi:MAG: hypothetical protein KatS3mg103_1254 [Phycisphaerales bacterium]|nr:MAG: hypothetical protein KatS3mg103_1254 [Phycisphaerales bacterium]
MQSLNADDLRIPPGDFDAVAHRGDRIRIERSDGAAIYLVGQDDLRALEAWEDQFDADEAPPCHLQARGLRRAASSVSKTCPIAWVLNAPIAP